MMTYGKRLPLIAALTLSVMISGCQTDNTGSPSTYTSITTGSMTEGESTATAETSEAEPTEGKVLNILCRNKTLQHIVEEFYPGYEITDYDTGTIGDITVVWDEIPGPNADGSYQESLEYAMQKQEKLPVDERADIFLLEPEFACQYVNSNYSLPLSEVGITEDDTAQMYEYTKLIGTAEDGTLKAVAYSAAPVVFAYRRSIAQQVLGTDDPEEVQKYIADIDSFNSTAQLMKENGFYILADRPQSYSSLFSDVQTPWVNENNELSIPESAIIWAELFKTYAENGYLSDNYMWSEEWVEEVRSGNKVFGYFLANWGVNFTISRDCPDNSGDWAICSPPNGAFQGGIWLCAGYRTDNAETVGEFLRTLCCNEELLTAMAKHPDYMELANNISAMEKIDLTSEFLGGQQPYGIYSESAKSVRTENISPYDYALAELFSTTCVWDYIDGEISIDELFEKFYDMALYRYPELKRAE